jgi:bifunctional DNA-binding transcriptional regulator/antitoxin component of YhaV-PrlF toxin-antitoxin module
VAEKGKVTIPLRLRRKYGIGPHTEVRFLDSENGILAGAAGSADLGLSTEGILALTRDEK